MAVFETHISSYAGQEICYFTIVPHSPSHFSDETPLASPVFGPETPADPSNPLLALREPLLLETPPLNMDASKILQLQTAVAYGNSTARPAPHQSNSNDSTTSTSSSSSVSSTPEIMSVARCVRCQRSSSVSSDSTKNGMIMFGTNLYYCSRCASLVGYGA